MHTLPSLPPCPHHPGLQEERRERRREYSFRDRALVTIKPASQQPPASQGGGSGQHERKRPRHERRHDRGGSGRLHRTSSRGRFRWG